MNWLSDLKYRCEFEVSVGVKRVVILKASEIEEYEQKSGLRCTARRPVDLPRWGRAKRFGPSDAWQPGYQLGLGKRIETRKEYNEEVKRRGLIEVGNEEFKPSINTPKTKYMDDAAINYVRDHGVSLDEGTVKQINDD